MIVFGFDPGGKDRSAVGVLRKENGRLSIKTVSIKSGAEALDWMSAESNGTTPDALGIDTFLHWSLGAKGWRPADTALKKFYPRLSKSIMSLNSTAGSMVGQGMAVAIGARMKWPNIALNEVHPKIIFEELWPSSTYPRGLAEDVEHRRNYCWASMNIQFEGSLKSEDEFDAAICCMVTYRGHIGEWHFDLTKGSFRKQELLVFPITDVTFYWPKSVE